jgi:Icc-related predicted phosphoesterase
MATTLYYASDVHGSNRCFRKFLNAAKFYKAQILVMGGDLLGKAIVFLEETRPGVYLTGEDGQRLELSSEAEVQEYEKVMADKGFYTYRCREGERDELYASDGVEPLFERLMRARLEEWLALAEQRLAGTGVRCYLMGGNDDPPSVLEVLDGGQIACHADETIVQLDEYSEMLSLGWSNPTPWNTPRECSEEELARRIDALMAQVKRPESLVMNIHVPPYGSGLDDAPELDTALKVQSSLGQTRFKPVGSTAVRAAIERYQPLLGLHGHIHEAHASCKIGRTLCINPGSDYGEGVLHGALASLHKGKLRGYQMVSG